MKSLNKTHKLVWLALLCFLIVIARPNTVYAADEVDSKDGQWGIIADYNKNTCTVTKWKGSSLSLDIPSYIDGLKVTKIDFETLFYVNNKQKITSISIPSTVTEIGGYSFSGFSSLQKVTIPNTVKTMGTNVFEYCSSLTEVTLPSGITEIPYGTFNGCSSLVKVKLPSKVKKIGNLAFIDCKSLTSFKIPSTVTELGGDCFAGSGLKQITIPSSVKGISSYMFARCESLTTVNLPSNLSDITNGMFKDCKALKSIVIPASCESVGMDAFSGCEELTTVLFKGNQRIYYNGLNPTAKLTVYASSSADKVKEYCSEEGIRFKPLDPPKITSKKRTTSTYTLKWKAVSGATGYRVYKKTGSGSYKLVKTTTGVSFKDTKLKKGTTYRYFVTTLKKDALGKTLASNASKICTNYLKK